MTKKCDDNVNNLPVRGEMFENLEDFCAPVDLVTFEWTAKGCGFGQLYFYRNEAGDLHCDSETMGKEFVKRMLCQMVDDCKLS